MKNEVIPTTDFTGFVTIGKMKIPVAVLYPESENPIRVIVQREIVGLLTGNKKGGFDRYLKPENLQKYVPEKFRGKQFSETLQTFKINGQAGRSAQAFEATDLIDLCEMYMRARTDHKLLPTQKNLAIQAEIIVFAFAKAGIIATIDEATGYQEVRDKKAIEKIVNMYVDEGLRKWAKRFPDDFYKQIFRLNGWHYEPTKVKKPQVIGKWTNKIVYSRFPKGVLAKLQDKNPIIKDSAGKTYREFQHHRFFKEIGNIELAEYISNAIFLMRTTTNMRKFWTLLAKATGQAYQLDAFDDMEST